MGLLAAGLWLLATGLRLLVAELWLTAVGLLASGLRLLAVELRLLATDLRLTAVGLLAAGLRLLTYFAKYCNKLVKKQRFCRFLGDFAKIPLEIYFSIVFTNGKRVDRISPPPSNVRVKSTLSKVRLRSIF